MKNYEVDILLYLPDRPQETRVTLRIPMADVAASKLLEAQANGQTIVEQTALYNLAGAVGFLNRSRAIPLRVREVGA